MPTPKKKRPPRPKIVIDPITGFPVLTAGTGTPKLANEEIAQILADFP